MLTLVFTLTGCSSSSFYLSGKYVNVSDDSESFTFFDGRFNLRSSGTQYVIMGTYTIQDNYLELVFENGNTMAFTLNSDKSEFSSRDFTFVKEDTLNFDDIFGTESTTTQKVSRATIKIMISVA
jgi:hypothetical protein